MPRIRKCPDAIPFDVASDWLTEAADFLAGDDDGWGLSEEARTYAVRYLRSVAVGKPLRIKRGAPDKGRKSEAARRVQAVLASGEADTLESAYELVAEQMEMDPNGLSGDAPRVIQQYCAEVWGQKKKGGARPVPSKELQEWFLQAFDPDSKSPDQET